MDMRIDIFADCTFGKLALQKIASSNQNFRLFEAGWLGSGSPEQREVMKVTGAEFREALSGKNKGRLSIMIPHTSRSVYVTAREMDEFEFLEAVSK